MSILCLVTFSRLQHRNHVSNFSCNIFISFIQLFHLIKKRQKRRRLCRQEESFGFLACYLSLPILLCLPLLLGQLDPFLLLGCFYPFLLRFLSCRLCRPQHHYLCYIEQFSLLIILRVKNISFSIDLSAFWHHITLFINDFCYPQVFFFFRHINIFRWLKFFFLRTNLKCYYWDTSQACNNQHPDYYEYDCQTFWFLRCRCSHFCFFLQDYFCLAYLSFFCFFCMYF